MNISSSGANRNSFTAMESILDLKTSARASPSESGQNQDSFGSVGDNFVHNLFPISMGSLYM